ncbi:MAG: recombination protein RecR [Bacteroidetes bacterium]|nr:MAG: recombination protein RecR [Bacteroidota bacterium]
MQYPSKLIESAVQEIARLPGIGKKTALRLALHILKQDVEHIQALTDSLLAMRLHSQYCSKCMNLSDAEICNICNSKLRNHEILCVVEDTKDVLALENTGHYNGLYYVLGGVISPVNGIGVSDLNFDKLIEKFPNSDIKEVILALSPTIDGDTTAFYLSKKLKTFGVKISTIARGVQVGSDLEYVDEITLGRSIQRRIEYDNL